jgi:hypothetical protein
MHLIKYIKNHFMPINIKKNVNLMIRWDLLQTKFYIKSDKN